MNHIWAMDTLIIGNDAGLTAAKYVQLVVDHHSCYVLALPTRANIAGAVISSLQRAIKESRPPKRLIVDNGTYFRSKRFQKFCTDYILLSPILLRTIPKQMVCVKEQMEQ